MIFDVVICAPRKILSDLRPAIPKLLVGINNKHIFFFRPLVLLDVRIEVIVPSI
jgi:hypothetical protein